jgi:hypothetical protein
MIQNNETLYKGVYDDGSLKSYYEVSNNSFAALANNQAILGGKYNTVSGDYAFIIGGWRNSASGRYAFNLGGERNNVTANNAFAIGGRYIEASHSGAGVIADAQARTHTSSGPNTLTLDFSGGTYIKNKVILQGYSNIPSTSNSFGVSGETAYDNNYHYRHNGTNWTRTAMSSW